MRYTKTHRAEFLSRPNRFIAKVLLNGKEETVHVKNTGRCKELLIPGVKVILEESDNPARKTRFDLVCVFKPGIGWINLDSQAPNQVVKEWLSAQLSKTAEKGLLYFPNITAFKPEYVFGSSRLDFYLVEGKEKCLMEVKGVTLEVDKVGYFPDAPTERGIKHMEELIHACDMGYRCYLAFVIQMEGIHMVKPNNITHPEFGETMERAKAAGVHILYLICSVTEDELTITEVREG
ncbi:MAG: DNA/RNA nuclease SfsA [Roseburia sp.]|nr:DNA/RNA nuclease SfsA [Roseburia sp.]